MWVYLEKTTSIIMHIDLFFVLINAIFIVYTFHFFHNLKLLKFFFFYKIDITLYHKIIKLLYNYIKQNTLFGFYALKILKWIYIALLFF